MINLLSDKNDKFALYWKGSQFYRLAIIKQDIDNKIRSGFIKWNKLTPLHSNIEYRLIAEIQCVSYYNCHINPPYLSLFHVKGKIVIMDAQKYYHLFKTTPFTKKQTLIDKINKSLFKILSTKIW